MRSTFAGLQMGLRALQAHQMGLSVTGHNIANANTEGYSRQRISLVPGHPYTVPSLNRPLSPGQMGTGVQVAEITRIRDEFIEMQLRMESQTTGQWEVLMDGYEQIEMVFNEPSDTGISSTLTAFWKSWQQLSLTPADLAARAVVRQTGALLADAISHTYTQLHRYREEVNGAIGVKVNRINYLAQQVADLNKQIVAVTVSGDHPNDLLDARDLLVKELAQITNIQAVTDDELQMHISISGSSLVQGSHVSRLGLREEPQGYRVIWEGAGDVKAVFNGGELKGLFQLRDDILRDGYMAELDRLAQALIEKVNEVHRQGYGYVADAAEPDRYPDGVDFFAKVDSGKWAQDISLSKIILREDGLNYIAAGLEGETGERAPGNGDNAMGLAGLLQETKLEQLNGSIPDFLSSLVASLGVDSQEAQRMLANQTILMEHLERRQEAVSGVALDEEMGNLIRFQHAYNAAARLITALDETLSVVIERMGIVGR
ncbi:MAG: flagellar hook-associated protein FlgK [Firmicutes bacterium]|nr:flagellar hook-associated protein FlgK [Bacillota bacterium]